MLRDIVAIFRDPLGYLGTVRAEFGPVVAFPTQPTRAWFVDDPDAVDRVLRTNAGNYTKKTVQYGALSLLTGNGLLTADNPQWLPRRRQVGPAFHRRTLERLVGCVGAAADGLDAEFASRVPGAGGTGATPTRVDVDGPLMRATLDVVSRGLFSADLGRRDVTADLGRRDVTADLGRRDVTADLGRRDVTADPGRRGENDIAGAVLDGLEEVMRRATRPLHAPRSWPTPGNRRLTRSLATLDAAVDAVVTSRAGAPTPADPDVLDLLLATLGDDPRAIRDEAVTLVVAGHETVASAMEWAAHLLATHPEVQDRTAEEAARVLGDRDQAPTLADVARLPLARAVLDETLRLYPPAWVVTRRATADDELAGHRLPAGTLVIVSPWVRHRDPAAWDEPSTFDPGRFLDHNRDPDTDARPTRPTGAYLPFGIGPRLCVGRDFALLEATLLLARLTLRWRLAPVPGHRVLPNPRVTVRPRGGLPLLVSPR